MCVQGCPVSVRIPEFIMKLRENDIDGAKDIILCTNSLPAITGRVCPQENQCQEFCIHPNAISIGNLERYVADNGHRIEKEALAKTNTKIAIVGSGPSGLTCAAELAALNHEVIVYEALHEYGGVLTYGIPEFRMPKSVVNEEIDYIMSLGVKFEKDVLIGRTITVDELLEDYKFNAVYIASGAGAPNFLGIPGESLNGVFSANEFLTRVNSEGEIPARLEEIIHAKEEGVVLGELTAPLEMLGDKKGNVVGLKCQKMELGEKDDSGRRRPIPIPESEFIFPVDTVIIAIGQRPNQLIAQTTSGLDTTKWGTFVHDVETGATTRDRIFCGGDVATGAATVILAMEAGRKAAKAIHEMILEKDL